MFQKEFIEVSAGFTYFLIFVQFQIKKWTVSMDWKISMVTLNFFLMKLWISVMVTFLV